MGYDRTMYAVTKCIVKRKGSIRWFLGARKTVMVMWFCCRSQCSQPQRREPVGPRLSGDRSFEEA